MQTTPTLPPKGIMTTPYVAAQMQRIEKEVPTVSHVETTAILPSDRVLIAQIVNARLSGTQFPENPVEIVPTDRKLKPYDVPMLPYEKETLATEDVQTESNQIGGG